VSCDLCVSICPFYKNNENETDLAEEHFSGNADLKNTVETGYYLDAYSGYSLESSWREKAASGGVARALLARMLEEDMVDKVLCVKKNLNKRKLFEFHFTGTKEEVISSEGSCYYPFEMSEVVRAVLSSDERYAFIALPCYVKSLRLLIKRMPLLKKRIKFIFGITCSHTVNKMYSEYICAQGGCNPKTVENLSFRVKDTRGGAIDHYAEISCVTDSQQKKQGRVSFRRKLRHIWENRYFVPNACNFCDDIFAELADISFMDAWLPEYIKDPLGTSLLLVRDKQVLDILKKMDDKNIKLEPVNIQKVIQSNRDVIFSKRRDISERIAYCLGKGEDVPDKRTDLLHKRTGFWSRIEIRIKMLISRRSNEQWIASEKDIKVFSSKMRKYEMGLSLIRKIRKLKNMITLFRYKSKKG
jgi:coenzyme F420-reducing hydrogenase beta subunit